MDLNLKSLLSLAQLSAQTPREGARLVMQARVPTTARWVAFALMAIMSSVMAHLSFGMMPSSAQSQMGSAMASPFRTAIMQGVLMLVAVNAIVWIGRWRGGKGTFDDALILMVWLQFIMLILQVAQIVIQVLLPPLAEIVGIASIAVFLWLLSNFVAEVHGFKSVGWTFFGVILSLLAMGFVLALVMVPFMGAVVP